MAMIQVARLTRDGPRSKEVRGGMRQSETAELHLQLKGGKEPALVRQGRRQLSSEQPAAGTSKSLPPPGPFQRAAQHLRWQCGMTTNGS